MEENLPPGFRFHPTDEELITYYLNNKVSDFGFTSKAIVDVDLNKCEPWDLPAQASMGDKKWYFFNLRDRKYPTGLRTNRATEAGYWKTTGKDREIFRGGILVGMKKTLVFYKGRAPKGAKTNWVMHEYRRETKVSFRSSKEEWVVCRVFQKSSAVKKPQQSPSLPQSVEFPCETKTNLTEMGDIELLNLNSFTNASSGLINVPLQNYNTDNNANMNVNWAAATSLPLLTWPSGLLSSNLSTNSWLLRALQIGNYQARNVIMNADYNPLLPPEVSVPQFGTDLSSIFPASSSKVLDTLQQQQQQQQRQEQPFNLDSIW